MDTDLPHIYLVRHGETEWSLVGRHTGRTDLPLTPHGEQNARRLKVALHGIPFEQVWTSPLQRARRTAELAGFGEQAAVDLDLQEVDYGQYEGRRTAEIRQERPDWDMFRDGCPGGESLADLQARADRVLARLDDYPSGNLLIFAHRHFLQVLAVRWIGLPVGEGRKFLLGTAALSVLSYYRSISEPVIARWNDLCHLSIPEERL